MSRWSLRARLLISLLALLALALTATGVIASVVLQSYLSQRVDEEMGQAVESLQRGPLERPRGGPRDRLELPSRYAVTVLAPNGATLVEASDPISEETPPDLSGITTGAALERAGEPYTVDADDGTPWRVLLSPLAGGRTLVLATSLEDVRQTTTRIRRTVLTVDLVVLVLGAAVGLAAVRGSLRPLQRIEETANAIAKGDLSRRVPQEGGPNTEVGRLSSALNGMLAQIESAFAVRTESERRIRRFMADASHELRTPLTSIRGFAELYRQGAVDDPEELARVMGRIESEATRMGGLVDDLLLLARLDEQRPLRREPVDLLVLAADAVHDGRATAPEHTLVLDAPASEADPVFVLGDEGRLRQVILNLMTNATRHTPAGTTVKVRVGRERDEAVLEVSDNGPGLPPSDGSVFDGFAPRDPARTRRDGAGSGLGLAIVAALVRGHGGDVEAVSRPGEGATFRVRLPYASVERPA